MKTIIGALVLVVVVVGGWFLVSRSAPVDETGPLKVGVVLPLTGDAAVYGEPLLRVAQIAAEEINASGGVNGRMLEFILEDGKCNGTDAASATQKLVNVDRVEVILGGFCSGESLASVPIAEQGKVAMFSPGSSSPDLTGVSDYFVRNYPSDAFQGKVLAEIAYNDKGWRTVAFIQEQTDYALGVYKAFTARFEELGGSVTNESFPTETTDFRSVVSKVRSGNPNAVFLSTQTPAVAARILTQIRELQWKPSLMVADVVPGDPETVSAHAAILEGALAAEFGVNPENEKFSAMVGAYKARHGEDLPYQGYAQTIYDAVYLIRDAIAAAGYDGTSIAEWLRTEVRNWEGAAGSVTIGADGDPTVGHRPEMIVGGKVVPYVK